MGKTKIALIDDSALKEEIASKRGAKDSKKKAEEQAESDKQLSVLSDQSSEESQSVISESVSETDQQTTEKPISEDRQQKTDNRKNSQKPTKTKPRSRKYQEATKDLDRAKTYPLLEAVEMAKKLSYSKFDGTLEVHINTSQTGIRGLVSLPFPSGKKLTILAFGKNAKESGADLVGSDETVEEINKGRVNFDLAVTTPDWMPKLAKVARILGPRGLMPNPKNGTITDDLKKAVESFQAGKTEYEHSSKQVYKTESKAPVIHLGMGKLSQPAEQLAANIKTLIQTLGKTRVKKISLSSTMGPSVKLDLSSL